MPTDNMSPDPASVPVPPHPTVWGALKIGLAGILQSKKNLTAIFTAIANAALYFGFQIDVTQAVMITSPLIGAIFGQTVVDVKAAGASGTQKVDLSVAAAPVAAPASTTAGSSSIVSMLALLIAAPLVMLLGLGCNLGARATAAARASVECGKSEVKSAAAELEPAFINNVKNAIGGDGKIDRPTFKSFAAPLKSSAARCALDAALAFIANPPPPAPGSPQSEPMLVDKTDLAAAYGEVREQDWGGVQIKAAAQ